MATVARPPSPRDTTARPPLQEDLATPVDDQAQENLTSASGQTWQENLGDILDESEISDLEDNAGYPEARPAHRPRLNASAQVDDQHRQLARHVGHIKLSDQLSGQNPQDARERDKADRATVAQVFDGRVQKILRGMLNQDVVSEIFGCIATGKEAKVYHGVYRSPDGAIVQHRALKVYRTRISMYRDHSDYVDGSHHKSSRPAIVKMRAEKEMRNLRRMHTAGIATPEVHHLKSPVLVMDLIGDPESGVAAPKLRDITFDDADDSNSRWQTCYVQILASMRVLYDVCHLVHADLSEYNILYWDDRPWLIDVSQAIEHGHPDSLDRLRKDIANISDFFARCGVQPLPERDVFALITAPSGATKQTVAEAEAAVRDIVVHATEASAFANTQTAGEDASEAASKREVDDQVFRQQFIPRTLEQVYDLERDLPPPQPGADLSHREFLKDRVQWTTTSSDVTLGPDISSESTATLTRDLPAARLDSTSNGPSTTSSSTAEISKTSQFSPISETLRHDSLTASLPPAFPKDTAEAVGDGASDRSESENGSESDDSDLSRHSKDTASTPRGKRFLDKDVKREHKRQVKEEKRERREHKMPKHVKKKLVQKSAAGKRR